MNLIRIWDLNNKEIDVTEYGLMGLRLIIPSPSYEVERETIPGRPGAITLGRDLTPRNLTAEFLVTATDYEDSLLLRDKLYTLFNKGSQFYIGEVKQPGKWWFVGCTEQWTPDRLNPDNLSITIPLLAEKGVAESISTTLNPNDLWQIDNNGEDLFYLHTKPVFNIYNAGNAEIDPRHLPLVISYKGASSNLSIKNLTTGDEWKYTGSSKVSDVITLEGIRSVKNNLTIFRNTNKRLIRLAPGVNEFELTGATNPFEISFDFRFYYL